MAIGLGKKPFKMFLKDTPPLCGVLKTSFSFNLAG